ncbi:hypothetical protein ES703_98919 [subsurface metagenome]
MAICVSPAIRTATATKKSCWRGWSLNTQPVKRILLIMKILSTMGAAAGAAKCLWTFRIPANIATIQTSSIYGSIIEVSDKTSLVSLVEVKNL